MMFKIAKLNEDAPDYGRAIGLSNARIEEMAKLIDGLKRKAISTGAFNSLEVLIEAVNTIPRSVEELVFLSLTYGYNACEMEHSSSTIRDFMLQKQKELRNELKNKGT